MADKPLQYQVSYVTEQDRMLLRINTEDRMEYRLWLTRHVLGLLWEALLKVIDAGPAEDLPVEADKREAILHFDHQTAVEQADFDTPFQEEASGFPLGEEGVLVVTAGVSRKAAGGFTLTLNPRQGKGINMNLNGILMHSFMQLLIDSSKHAQWGLDLRLPASDSTLSADSATPGNILRH